MKKIVLTSLLVSTLAFAETSLFPVMQDGYKSNIGIAALGGLLKGSDSDSDYESFFGLEISLDCPILRLESGNIRQQLNITQYNHDGLKIQELNLNPHYIIPISNTTSFGIGPSYGIAKVDIGRDDDTAFTYGFGTSLRTDLGNGLFVGGEFRYTLSTDASLLGIDDDIDNTKFMIKIGQQY